MYKNKGKKTKKKSEEIEALQFLTDFFFTYLITIKRPDFYNHHNTNPT